VKKIPIEGASYVTHAQLLKVLMAWTAVIITIVSTMLGEPSKSPKDGLLLSEEAIARIAKTLLKEYQE
jgi:hypothetical protein